MAESTVALQSNYVPPDERKRAIARVYAFLLSLPNSRDIKDIEEKEPAVKDLGQDITAGSGKKTPEANTQCHKE
jgi:hypothetical protein